MMYREDLMKSLERDEAKEDKKTSYEETTSDFDENIEEPEIEINEDLQPQEEETPQVIEVNKSKETNWTNLLLGRLK